MELHFKALGEGDPIVILHGLFGMLDNWKSIGNQLARDYQVVLVDLRNHGRSPHSEEVNYLSMADDVAQLMESQWLYQATVIGHSMGGKVAMQLAIDHTDLVGKLVVVDIAPKAYPPHHQTVIEALQSVEFPTAQSRSDIQDQLARHLDDESTILFLMKNVKREGDSFAWRMHLDALVRHYDEIGNAIDSPHTYDGPAVFVRGSQSSYVLDQDMSDIRGLFPKAELVTIPDAGHWVHADQPAQMLKVIREFQAR